MRHDLGKGGLWVALFIGGAMTQALAKDAGNFSAILFQFSGCVRYRRIRATFGDAA